jgi:hypothetical protein
MRLKLPRVFRDPVHDIISWEREGILGQLIVTLIDTPEFQRLRFVRQVGLASLVFHGAEHSRFSHSMGVAHLARRMLDQLNPDQEKQDPDRMATIIAALLHDLGHGPFSHAMERVFDFKHEDYTRSLILDESSEVCRVLQTVDRGFPEQVAQLIDAPKAQYPADIVSSQLDADRFDYLLRDSLMTGVEVGRYDLERILLMLEHDDAGLIVNCRAFESIEGYLVARYHMYRLVYFHKTVRAAESMLRMLFTRAHDLLKEGQKLDKDHFAFIRWMRGETLPPNVFSQLSEIDAWAQIRRWSECKDAVLADLASSLIERRIFSTKAQIIENPETESLILKAEEAIREALDFNSRQYLFLVDVAEDVPYKPYLPGSNSKGDSIRIRDRDGSIYAIEDRSLLVKTLGQASYKLRRWCYHPKISPVVEMVMKKLDLT